MSGVGPYILLSYYYGALTFSSVHIQSETGPQNRTFHLSDYLYTKEEFRRLAKDFFPVQERILASILKDLSKKNSCYSPGEIKETFEQVCRHPKAFLASSIDDSSALRAVS